MTTTKTVGENALQRTIRLLKKFNINKIEDGEYSTVQLRFNPNGSGELILITNEPLAVEQVVYSFDTPEQAVVYLNADALSQILLSRK